MLDINSREEEPMFEVPEPLLQDIEAQKNIPVEDTLDVLQAEIEAVMRAVQALRAEMAPLAPFLAALPDLMETAGPFLEGLKNSPVLKMLGIKV